MIYDSNTLKIKYQDYANINQKIVIEANKNNIVRIKRGLYSDNIREDKMAIANYCCGPSYISFEYALAVYGLIPEYVSVITCAVLAKNKIKRYNNDYLSLEYRHVPDAVFSYSVITVESEGQLPYRIASKEKAICDTLYNMYPVRTMKDLKALLFDNLRIDEDALKSLDKNEMIQLAYQYHSNTLNMFASYLLEELIYENLSR